MPTPFSTPGTREKRAETAIAQTLAGENNPAGRLPVTFYKGTEQLPDFEDYAMKDRTYRYFTKDPLYPFGYGLSYSTFECSGLTLSSPQLQAGNSLDVEVDVKNTSKREGDEVVELYMTFPKLAGAPLRAFRGFTRVHLGAGEQKHVQLTLGPRDLRYVDEAGNRLVGAGDYVITGGEDSRARQRRMPILSGDSGRAQVAGVR
jgi:beta-glucosidase